MPKELWDEVQETITARASGGARRRAKYPSLLAGLLVDGEERPMTPSHATKGKQRYRYYVTRPDMLDRGPAWRTSAHALEALVRTRIATLLTDVAALHSLVEAIGGDAQRVQTVIAAGDLMAATLRSGSIHDRLVRIDAIAPNVKLEPNRITISIAAERLFAALGNPVEDVQLDPIILACDAARVRRGHELSLVIPSPKAPPPPAQRNEKLVTLVAEAHAALELVTDNSSQSIASIAAGAGRCRTRLAKLATLGCLAPDIVTAIVERRQPVTLDQRALMATNLPLDWAEQRAVLGIG